MKAHDSQKTSKCRSLSEILFCLFDRQNRQHMSFTVDEIGQTSNNFRPQSNKIVPSYRFRNKFLALQQPMYLKYNAVVQKACNFSN